MNRLETYHSRSDMDAESAIGVDGSMFVFALVVVVAVVAGLVVSSLNVAPSFSFTLIS